MVLQNFLNQFLRFFIEGLAVASVAYLLQPEKFKNFQHILLLGMTAGVLVMVLDLLAPEVGQSTRMGMGLGLGLTQVGVSKMVEPFNGNMNDGMNNGMNGGMSGGMSDDEVVGVESGAIDY